MVSFLTHSLFSLGDDSMWLPGYIRLILRRYRSMSTIIYCSNVCLRVILIISAIIAGCSFYYRTTNMWTLKNIGDTFLRKSIGRRPIIIDVFYRPIDEYNPIDGYSLVILFLGDVRLVHQLYCFSSTSSTMGTRALIQRIHEGKRSANDICSWSGYLAECRVAEYNAKSIR